MLEKLFYYIEQSDSGVGYDLFLKKVEIYADDLEIVKFVTHIGKINTIEHANIIKNMLNEKIEKLNEVED
jgi:hypothetical protein